METINFIFCRDGSLCSGSGDQFEKSDIKELIKVYYSWKELNNIYSKFNIRRATFPELLSEGLASAIFDWIRVNSKQIKGLSSSSCDLIDLNHRKTIQLKACSTDTIHKPGPTSFGPRSEFDRLIFMHVDCEADIANFYELDEKSYKNWKVNKTQTIEDQQNEGRRPRLTILPKIIEYGIQPFFTFNFNMDRRDEN